MEEYFLWSARQYYQTWRSAGLSPGTSVQVGLAGAAKGSMTAVGLWVVEAKVTAHQSATHQAQFATMSKLQQLLEMPIQVPLELHPRPSSCAHVVQAIGQ